MAKDVVEKDQEIVQPVDHQTSNGVKGKTQGRIDEMGKPPLGQKQSAAGCGLLEPLIISNHIHIPKICKFS